MTNTQDLFEAVLTRDNLTRAWKLVKSNHGAPGINGITVDDFAAHAREHWPVLHEQLKGGRYQPQAVRRVEIPKTDGGKRLLGIPTVTDRVKTVAPVSHQNPALAQLGRQPEERHPACRQ